MDEASTFMMFDYEIDKAVFTLQEGGTLLFPTDTIWGIGCDACNAEAVSKVYELKQRDLSKPFVLLADSIDMIKHYVSHVHPKIETLLSYHVRPLTVVYDRAKGLAPNAIGEDGSVAIRIPLEPFCHSVVKAFGKPVVATSANVSNEPFPTDYESISPIIKKGVNYILKARKKQLEFEQPSPIVKLSRRGELVFIRE